MKLFLYLTTAITLATSQLKFIHPASKFRLSSLLKIVQLVCYGGTFQERALTSTKDYIGSSRSYPALYANGTASAKKLCQPPLQIASEQSYPAQTKILSVFFFYFIIFARKSIYKWNNSFLNQIKLNTKTKQIEISLFHQSRRPNRKPK